MTPAGTIEVVQRDTTVPAIAVTTDARRGTVMEVKSAGGHRVFDVDADGGASVTRLRIATNSGSILGTGVLFVDADGWLVFRGAKGTVTKVAAP